MLESDREEHRGIVVAPGGPATCAGPSWPAPGGSGYGLNTVVASGVFGAAS